NKNIVLTRKNILDKLWDGNGSFVDDNTLSVYVRRLRNKIEDKTYITTSKNSLFFFFH
ncbi:winged helix-turn-helix domain-containing protein, partial [Clostridioides difficile]|uniref:winged helix-turn-helix domain-containing protein n=1 Tax=Clostridioides difficile TaxID=1496 RepID=UPI00115C4B7C